MRTVQARRGHTVRHDALHAQLARSAANPFRPWHIHFARSLPYPLCGALQLCTEKSAPHHRSVGPDSQYEAHGARSMAMPRARNAVCLDVRYTMPCRILLAGRVTYLSAPYETELAHPSLVALPSNASARRPPFQHMLMNVPISSPCSSPPRAPGTAGPGRTNVQGEVHRVPTTGPHAHTHTRTAITGNMLMYTGQAHALAIQRYCLCC